MQSTRDPIAAARPLTLFSSGLLSKYGFNDGDMPDEVDNVIDELRWQEAIDPTWERPGWHCVLIRLVREYLLPVLSQKVEVVEIGTSHNPIRAETVDGVDVEECWFERQPEPELTPEAVEIPMADVIRICREVADGAGSDGGGMGG